MNWYWVISNDNTVDDPFVSDQDDLGGFDTYTLATGQPIEGWPASAWVKASRPSNDGDPDDSLQNHLGILIFSERLQQALNQAAIKDTQYLPLAVVRRDDRHIDGFSAVNILNLVPALDLEGSTYDRFPDDYFIPERRGDLSGLRNVTLRSAALGGRDVIRLHEYPLPVYGSERFRDVFERGLFTGLSFVPVNLS